MTSTGGTMPEGSENTQPSATPAATTTPTAPSAPTGDTSNPSGDQPLGDGGKRALEAEREARRELERQITSLKEGLAGVFGGKPDGKASTEDVIAGLSQQVADMQRDALVYRLAAQHKITEKDDIDLLRSAKDEDAMTRLATRLAAPATGPTATPGTPKPDLTQGGGQGGPPPALNSDALTDSLKRAVGAQ